MTDKKTKQEEKYKYLTQANIEPLIVKMAIPTIISMLTTSFYNMADTFFVSKINTQSTAAVGIVFSMMAIIQAIGFFFGHGSGNYISIKLGAKDTLEASKMAATGFLSAMIVGFIILIFGIIFINPLAHILGSTNTILPYSKTYMKYILIGAPYMTASIVLNNQLRLQGNALFAMIGLISGAIINIILDPIMIFGLGPIPAMGIEGAAWATCIGQTVTLLIYIIAYLLKAINIKMSFKYLKPGNHICWKVYSIGIPASLNMALPSLLVSALNGILSSFSPMYVVILGIYYKLQTFIYLPANGIIQGMRPILSYNYGAKEYKRVKKIYKYRIYSICFLNSSFWCIRSPW